MKKSIVEKIKFEWSIFKTWFIFIFLRKKVSKDSMDFMYHNFYNKLTVREKLLIDRIREINKDIF